MNIEFASTALESHPDGIAVMNGHYQVLFANPQYGAMWGLSASELNAMSPEERFSHQLSMLSNPQTDALMLRMMIPEENGPSTAYFKLKNGQWYERIVSDHRVMGEKFGVVVQWRNVTDSHSILLVAQHERDLMHSMMDSVPDQIFFKDLDSRFIRINTSLAKRYGLNDPAEALGKTDADFYSADHAAQTRNEELEIMRTGNPVMNQLHNESWSDGRESWNVSMKMPLFDTRGVVIGTYGIAHDITEHKKAEALIWKQANFDALTGLPNRRMLRDRWEQTLNGHKRSGHGLALLMLDLDHFKEVNDTMGHAVGDELLIEASARISQCLRTTDTLARMGGDEFAVILTDLVGTANIGDLTQKIVSSLNKPFFLAGNAVVISASIGISLFPQDGEGIDELLKLADQAMYEAKNRGRNCFSFFTADLQQKAQLRLRMANDLRHALAAGEFHLVYQPIIDMATGSVTKAEALIRWNHPKLGLIPPGEFIPVAESIGLIVAIGDWVFRTAALQAKKWRQNGLPNLQVSVNKSPLQFQHKCGQALDWGEYLASIGLPPEAIVVEITEGLLLDASPQVQSELEKMREIGLKVSLDDFGTGYSSMSYLQRFDIDYVKIDQSFMKDLCAGSKNLTLCKAIVRMSHELGMEVIVEGLETELQRDLLTQTGCNFGQGYFYSRPVIAAEFEDYCQRAALLNESGLVLS
jgi:diguanylate cyclase (GGDEF)-like protein/PAS domain S-box-containing protein